MKCVNCGCEDPDKVTCVTSRRINTKETIVSDDWYCSTCKTGWCRNKQMYVKGEALPYRTYKVAELLKMRPGTCFIHQTLGKCIIMKDENERFYVQFKKPELPPCGLASDHYPWNFPMKILS